MGSVKERFPREATSKEIWWSRLVDGKEPVCSFAGTFVMIVGALVTSVGYLYPGTTLVMIKLDHKKSCPWVKIAQVTKAPTIKIVNTKNRHIPTFKN